MKNKILTKQKIKEFLLINLGVLMMAAAYSILLHPNKVIVGGIGGLSTILTDVCAGTPLEDTPAIFILVINVVLLLFALIYNQLYVKLHNIIFIAY